MRPVITLTTDFGLDDPFVGIMKGVILNIAPDVEIIDITHNIEPQNIIQAALVLNASYSWFPRKTVHIVIVDPGVGGKRRPMVVQSKFQFFVGPDNGVLTPVLDFKNRFYQLTNKKYFLKNVSNTFHGRDIFAAVAAWITTGIAPSKMGPRILKPEFLTLPQPCIKEGTIQGKIIYKDRFGNLTTNISAELINEKFPSFDKIKIQTGKQIINGLSKAYNKIKLGEPGAIINSWNQLEIFCRQADAAKKLKLKLGQSITLKPVLHSTNKRISPIIKK